MNIFITNNWKLPRFHLGSRYTFINHGGIFEGIKWVCGWIYNNQTYYRLYNLNRLRTIRISFSSHCTSVFGMILYVYVCIVYDSYNLFGNNTNIIPIPNALIYGKNFKESHDLKSAIIKHQLI